MIMTYDEKKDKVIALLHKIASTGENIRCCANRRVSDYEKHDYWTIIDSDIELLNHIYIQLCILDGSI